LQRRYRTDVVLSVVKRRSQLRPSKLCSDACVAIATARFPRVRVRLHDWDGFLIYRRALLSENTNCFDTPFVF